MHSKDKQGFRKKIVPLTAMFEDVKKVNEDYLSGYRLEVRIREIQHIYDAYEMAEDFFCKCDLPQHVRLMRTVRIDTFYRIIRDALNAL